MDQIRDDDDVMPPTCFHLNLTLLRPPQPPSHHPTPSPIGAKYGMPKGIPERDYRPCLSNLAVRKDARRGGIGTRLAQVCEEVALQVSSGSSVKEEEAQ